MRSLSAVIVGFALAAGPARGEEVRSNVQLAAGLPFRLGGLPTGVSDARTPLTFEVAGAFTLADPLQLSGVLFFDTGALRAEDAESEMPDNHLGVAFGPGVAWAPLPELQVAASVHATLLVLFDPNGGSGDTTDAGDSGDPNDDTQYVYSSTDREEENIVTGGGLLRVSATWSPFTFGERGTRAGLTLAGRAFLGPKDRRTQVPLSHVAAMAGFSLAWR